MHASNRCLTTPDGRRQFKVDCSPGPCWEVGLGPLNKLFALQGRSVRCFVLYRATAVLSYKSLACERLMSSGSPSPLPCSFLSNTSCMHCASFPVELLSLASSLPGYSHSVRLQPISYTTVLSCSSLLLAEQTTASHRASHTPAAIPTRPLAPAARRGGQRGAGRRGGLFGLFYQLPLAVARTGVRLVLSAAGVGASFVACLLPGPALRMLQGQALRLHAPLCASCRTCLSNVLPDGYLGARDLRWHDRPPPRNSFNMSAA